MDPTTNGHNKDTKNKISPSGEENYQIVLSGENMKSPPNIPKLSVDAFRRITEEANKLKLCGIPGAFNIFRERPFEIWLDSNSQLKEHTRTAILLTALYLLHLGKSVNCNMNFYFTSYPNTKSKSLSPHDIRCLQYLTHMWNTKSWEEAIELLKRTNTSEFDLGIQKWLDEGKSFVEGDTDNDKHLKLRDLVQKKMYPFWHGWQQQQLTAQGLMEYYSSAVHTGGKMPRSLNFDRFAPKPYLVNRIFLMGSPIKPTEIVDIKKCQSIQRHGSHFHSSAVVMAKHMSSTSVAGYRDIFNIYNLPIVDETKVLHQFLGSKVIFKISNCHDEGVNNLQFNSDNELYGDRFLVGDNNAINLPSHEQMNSWLDTSDASTLNRAGSSNNY